MEKLNIKEGSKYNRLTVIREIERKVSTKRRFLCLCDCGGEKEVNLIHLTSGRVKSCGCTSKNWHKEHRGEKSPTWKGGRILDEGYVGIRIPDHPRAKSNGYVKEHILVMEKFLGRALLKGENVHHLNGDKTDNRVENLELWNISQPCGQRVHDKIKWAKEIIELYKKYI